MVILEKDGEQISYALMVARLFKPMEGVGSRMMHAAIGIAGESGEIRNAMSRKNLKEELGDIEFYLEAAWQEVDLNVALVARNQARCFEVTAFGDISNTLHTLSSEILDHAKKVWVYQGSKGGRDAQIAELLIQCEMVLISTYALLGFERPDILLSNMQKLIGGTDEAPARYSTGHYSDEQALAKADHKAERKFMTDTPEYTDAERAARGL